MIHVFSKIYSAESLDNKILASIFYHDIFDYPLTAGELIKWEAGKKIKIVKGVSVDSKDGFYFLKGRGGVIIKRLLKRRVAVKKLKIARKAGQILSFIPTIRMVGITGALAMENASPDSDIDLLIVTQKGFLWTSRFITLLFLKLIGFPIRKFGDENQKDKLCLNMWLDESNLSWPAKDRNPYTAHEIAQIIPLIDKQGNYQQLLWKNKWIRQFWPNAVRIQEQRGQKIKKSQFLSLGNLFWGFIELAAMKLQFWYMRKKITREKISPTRAIFHPHDWGKVVLARLTS